MPRSLRLPLRFPRATAWNCSSWAAVVVLSGVTSTDLLVVVTVEVDMFEICYERYSGHVLVIYRLYPTPLSLIVITLHGFEAANHTVLNLITTPLVLVLRAGTGSICRFLQENPLYILQIALDMRFLLVGFV